MNAGANAKGAEKLQRAQREYGGERKRRRSYAEVAEKIPNYLKRQANSICPPSPHQARNPSFPRRRESMSALFMPLDSRLRGNDGFWGLRSFMKNKSAPC